MGFWNQKGDYYSNCLIEAIKAKIKWKSQIKIIYIPPNKNDVFCPHFMWHDLVDDNIKDFHNVTWSKGGPCNETIFLGYIRVRPYSVYERWKKTNR